jgi:3-hydroxyisobutyrate dehydrogenase-like beta-hydroxyacid dehydrogenase
MRIAVLGATGATGRQLLDQALDRGHLVTALARDPARVGRPPSDRLQVVAADVRDAAGLAAALTGVDAVVSGLGSSRTAPPGTLTAGATAVTAPTPDAPPWRVVWLGALGSGVSGDQAGAATRLLLRVVLGGPELADKTRADDLLLAAGASVLHAGPLTDGALSPTRHLVALADAPRRLFPGTVSRATVAALMLDEAEGPRHGGAVAVPLT